MPTPNHIRDSSDFAHAFGVSRETLGCIEVYAELLRTWQRTINLVAPGTVDDLWHRHMADSAQVYDAWQREAPGRSGVHWLDLGSGAGFPGLVAGLMGADGAIGRLTLVDSDQRKCAFLREVVRVTGLKARMAVDIVAGRIELPANHLKVGSVEVVSARALAPLPRLIEWAAPYFGPNTIGLFPKGRDAVVEVASVPASAGLNCRLVESSTEAGASIVVVRRA